jgi:hypothetical protein
MKAKLILIVVTAALAAGCGGPNAGAVDNFIKAMAQAQCAWEFRCCTDAEIRQKEMMKFKDEATCVQFAQLALEDEYYAQRLAVRQGRIKVDTGKASACTDERTNKMCNPMPGSPPPPPPTPGTIDPCTQVFVGNTSVGDACQFANECIKGAHCVPTGAVGEGVCVPYQEETQICNVSTDCDPTVTNLYCAQKDFTCHLRSPVGGPCAYTIDPVSMMPTTPVTLECDDTSGSVYCDPKSSTCQNLPGAGMACLQPPLPPGLGAVCASGLVCDNPAGGGTCRGPGNVGDDCTRVACATTLYCDRTMTPNTCKDLPGLGAQCNVSGFRCAKPYFCNTGVAPAVCAQPQQLGQPCNNTTMLCDNTLFCDNTSLTCKARLADGAPCTSSQMCLSLQCLFTATGGTCAPSQTVVQCVGR